TALLGLIIITASACLAFVAPRNLPTVITALTLLGLGWSASIIASSVLLGSVDSGEVRVPLQGATDALMSYGGAAAALLAGVLLAALGFGGLAVVMLLVLIPAAVTGWIARPMARASHPA
ncbi:MAG TPA: MFS transporter, partial [Tessaracoccus flavescens]|nr:MFS transporter [Tessaracoccus flavescens]